MSDLHLMKHWLEQLTDILVPHIHEGIKSLYYDAKKINRNKPLQMFQLVLETIPNISQNKLETDYRVLIKKRGGKRDWMRKILKVIFGAQAKIDLVARGAQKNIKIKERDLQIPDDITFLHKCYIEAARTVWVTPYLFSDKYDSIQQQKHHALAFEKIERAIEKTIRKLIPFEQLQYRYLSDSIYSASVARQKKHKDHKKQHKHSGSESDNLETMLDKDSKQIFEFSRKSGRHSRSQSRSRESTNLKDSILSEKRSESERHSKKMSADHTDMGVTKSQDDEEQEEDKDEINIEVDEEEEEGQEEEGQEGEGKEEEEGQEGKEEEGEERKEEEEGEEGEEEGEEGEEEGRRRRRRRRRRRSERRRTGRRG